MPFTVFIALYLEDEIVACVRDVPDSLVFDNSDRCGPLIEATPA